MARRRYPRKLSKKRAAATNLLYAAALRQRLTDDAPAEADPETDDGERGQGFPFVGRMG